MRRTPSLYQFRPTGLHRLHPLTKTAFVITGLVGAAALPNLPALLAVFLFGLSPLAAWGKVLSPFLRASGRALAPFFVSLLVVQGFFTPGREVLFRLGPLTFTAEGLSSALLFASRLLLGLSSAILLLLTTRLDHLMLALTERGLSRQISYIVVTALQIVPHFQVRAQMILDAQRSRGLETEGGLLRRLAALRALVVPLLLSSLLETDKRAIALEARAFRLPGPKTSWATLSDTRPEQGLRWLCLILSLAMLGGRFAYVLLPR